MVYIKEKDFKICKLPVDQNLKYESDVIDHDHPSPLYMKWYM